MKRGDAFPGQYLKHEDLGQNQPVVVIDRVTRESLGSGKDKEDKAVAYFQGKSKGLVLNKTNWNTIEKLTGRDDSDHWRGFQIQLYVTQTQYGDEMVDCIRVRVPQGARPPAAPPPPPPPDDFQASDDDVPF